jgi:chromosome segregation ATPase
MGPEALLKSACELSYVIARSGVESDPAIEPPQAMRSFLYVADLPERALAVAKSAIEDDPAFRRRVAEQATEDEVGRGGYLWLHRPIGWSAEFEELAQNGGEPLLADDNGPQSASVTDSVDTGELPATGYIETVPAIAEDRRNDNNGAGTNGLSRLSSSDDVEGSDADPGSVSGSHDEADAIEDELSSLRGLVDRLASERQAVSMSIERVEDQVESARHQPSVFDSDVYTLRSELDAARTELEEARRERDGAVQQHSVALTRQLELEKELDLSRELRAEVEREHTERDARLVELQEELVRTEGVLGPVQLERDELAVQTESLSAHNEELMTELARLNQERASTARAVESERQAAEFELSSVRAEVDQLNTKLDEMENELFEVCSQLSASSTQASEAKSLVEALTEEKIDLASRLADTEAMLETTRTQLGAVKADSEALTADLSNIKAHRDGLATQVEELHGSLTDALESLARVRETSESDRSSLKDIRAERDQLKLRISALEQVESGLEAKLANVTTERAALSTKADEAKVEVGELEQKVGELAGENEALSTQVSAAQDANSKLKDDYDSVTSELEEVRRNLGEVEEARGALSQQVDQLNAENSAIQDQLVESDRLRVETQESQGHAVSELANRLSLVEKERDKLEERLTGTESELAEAKLAIEESSEKAAKAEADSAKAKADAFEALTAKADAEKALSKAEKTTTEAEEKLAEAEKAKAKAEKAAAEATEALFKAEKAGAEYALASLADVSAADESTVAETVTVETGDEATDDLDAEATAVDDLVEAESTVEADQETGDEVSGSIFGSLSEQAEDEAVTDDVSPSLLGGDDSPGLLDKGLVLGDEQEAELEEALTEATAVDDASPVESGSNGRIDLSQPRDPEDGSVFGSFGTDSPPGLLGDDEVDESGADRTTKRHSWSLGPLLRGRKGAEDEGTGYDDQSVPPPPPPPGTQSEVDQDDDLDAIAAAVAEAARGGDQGPTDEPGADVAGPDPIVSDPVQPDGGDDIKLIGAKLADAMADSGPSLVDDTDEDDLDAISDLISQTVSDFDSKPTIPPPPSLIGDEDHAGTDGEPVAAGDEDDTAVHPTEGWGGLPAAAGPGDRADRSASRGGGMAPPSIFNGSGSDSPFGDDPFGTDDGPGLGPDPIASPNSSGEGGDGASRRQIVIPEDLRNDEVEMARHVVSSPDVVLLVDGDSVAKMGWPSLPVAQQRDALVSYLADLSASSGAAPDVVFDGRIGEEDSLPASRAVRIRLSTPPTEPAAALDELVDAYPEQWPIAVVTDDDDLAASAVERGAVALNNGQLLDLFIAQ